MAGQPLADDDMALWSGDGVGEMDWTWSQRDAAMAERLLARTSAGSGTLAVAGNAHTPTGPTSLGVPLGAHVARRRPGVRSIRIEYGGGGFYNLEPRRFRPRPDVSRNQVGLRQQDGQLVLDQPNPTEATVPQQLRGQEGHRPASRR